MAGQTCEQSGANKCCRWRKWTVITLACVAGFIVCLLLDHKVFAAVPKAWDKQTDLLRMLRIFGFGGFWLVVAVALLLIDRPLEKLHGPWATWRRFTLLTLVWIVTGVAAELLKIVVRRERPSDDHAGSYIFRAWSDQPFHSGGLGLPSSHAAVAFGAAWMLSRLHPKAAPVWFLGAIGCAASRIIGRDHYLSDVYVAAVLGYFVVAFIWSRRSADGWGKPGHLPVADPDV